MVPVSSLQMQKLLRDKLPKRYHIKVHLKQLEVRTLLLLPRPHLSFVCWNHLISCSHPSIHVQSVMRAVLESPKGIKAAAIVARTGFGRVQVRSFFKLCTHGDADTGCRALM